jgi:hypothetical protein
MALQHHFVVVVEDGKISIDLDTTDAAFYDGSIHNNETGEWEINYDHARANELAHEILWNKLNKEDN